MNELLKSYINIADGIVATFGSKCEVVIHDFENLDASVVYIAGNITKRTVGAPATDIILRMIRNNKTEDSILNHKFKTEDGKILRSSTIFIHDEKGKAIGSMGINFEVTDFLVMKNLFHDILSFSSDEHEDPNPGVFMNEINQVFESIIKKHIDEYGKPVRYMLKEEKLEIIKKLDESGAFIVKGGVDRIANELGVSRYTLYNYIGELKSD